MATKVRLALLITVPLPLVLAYFHVGNLWVFGTASIAIMVLAEWIRRATVSLAALKGGVIGGLLNVSFGNATESILAVFVLKAGHRDVVKASITGSVVSNSLLGLGPAILVVTYVANLIYTVFTHRDVFAGEEKEPSTSHWSLMVSLQVLVGATIVVALEAPLISNTLESTAAALGISRFFLGIVLLPIIGNMAEYLAALSFARKDQVGVVMSIAVGSSIQVTLLMAPILVLLSYVLGYKMNLVFGNPLELIAIAGVAFAVNAIAQDGETTWFEGLLLVAVYALLAPAFFFVTPS